MRKISHLKLPWRMSCFLKYYLQLHIEIHHLLMLINHWLVVAKCKFKEPKMSYKSWRKKKHQLQVAFIEDAFNNLRLMKIMFCYISLIAMSKLSAAMLGYSNVLYDMLNSYFYLIIPMISLLRYKSVIRSISRQG